MDLALRGKSLSNKTSGTLKKVQLVVRCCASTFGVVECALAVVGNTALAGMLSIVAMVVIIPS